MLAVVDAVHVGGQLVEELQAQCCLVFASFGFVAEVVGEAGEAVQGGQVAAVGLGEHAQRDGEVLAGGVGGHILGTRNRRADVRPFRSAISWHPVIFQGMRN